jgi:hypothetical protein
MEDAIEPQEWDAQGKPIQSSSASPSGATEWDASGKPIKAQDQPGWSLSSVLSGTDPAHQAIDKAAQTEPVDTSSVGGFAKSVANNLGAGAVRIFSPLAHPLNTAAGLAKTMAAGYGNTGAQQDLGQGMVRPFVENPSGEAVAAIPQAALALAGGGEGSTVANALEKGPPGGAVGAVGDAARAGVGKLIPALIDGPPESLMTRAVKPGKNNTGWNRDVGQAIPLMKSAEEQLGRPVAGIDDALEAAGIAKKGIWQQYQARIGAGGQMGASIDGSAIADQMVSSIDKRTALQNPGLVDKVRAIADTYRRPLSLNEAEDFLQSANKDLNTYYTKNKVGQQVAMNDPEISSTVAEAEALRKALYSKLDQVSGPGAAQLKQAYGSLTNVEKELYGRQLVAARQAPESLSEQLSTVRGAGKIAKGVFTGSPGDVLEGAQNIAVSRALKARNSSDAMIERAFQAAQPAQPFPMPSSPRIAGLLQRGPVQMPAPPEVGGTPAGYQPPPFYADTDQMRLGRLLPARSGAPTILPPEAAVMTAGERSAALNQWLRQRQQLALPAKANAIQLPPPR